MTQHDPHTSTPSQGPARGRYARMTVAAAATAAAMVAAAPAIAGADPLADAVAAPEPPMFTTAVDGNDVTITLTDLNTDQSTTCTAALVNVDKATPLLPALAAGTFPPLSEIDPSVFTWGPSSTTTDFTERERTYQVDDVPTGFYATVGICTNTGGVASDYALSLIGPSLGLGSAGSLGSTGSSTGSLGSSVHPDGATGSLGSSAGSLGSSAGILGSATGSSTGSLGSSTAHFTGSLGSSTGSSTNSLGSTDDGIYLES